MKVKQYPLSVMLKFIIRNTGKSLGKVEIGFIVDELDEILRIEKSFCPVSKEVEGD